MYVQTDVDADEVIARDLDGEGLLALLAAQKDGQQFIIVVEVPAASADQPLPDNGSNGHN